MLRPHHFVGLNLLHKLFYRRLQDHTLRRFQNLPYTGTDNIYDDAERRRVVIENYRLFQHLHLGINYTTYDMRRNHDSLNPTTHPDVMVLSTDTKDVQDAHPYCYARIIGIYHALVVFDGRRSQRLDFLHVRWLRRDSSGGSIWQTKRLPRLSFVPHDEPDAFGFLDPADVIRAVHLLPGFRYGRTSSLLPPTSIGRVYKEPEWYNADEDWNWLYVGM